MANPDLRLRAIALFSTLSPWWRFRLYKRLIKDPYGCGGPDDRVRIRVSPHNYEMELSRADWMERFTIDTGYFFHAEIIAALQHFLRPGDSFVDVGANVGFVTLTGARLVGPAGQVFSFEPNRDLAGRLLRTFEENGIGNVSLSRIALADRTGELVLVSDNHHGNRHVSTDPKASGDSVPVSRADDQLRDKLPEHKRILIKIDVEGAEMMVLRGMTDLIGRSNMVFLIEINDEMLRRNGASAGEVFALMQGAGYTALIPRISPFSGKLAARPLGERKPSDHDFLFVRAE
jgi:FkbM family methyltransferase